MSEFPSAVSLCEAAGNRGALPPRIRAVTPTAVLWGPAFPVATAPGHNYWLHRALIRAPRESVLVVDAHGDTTSGYWGALMTVAAISAGLGGLIIDGAVRDVAELDRLGFPVFAIGLAIRGTGKDRAAGGGVDCSIQLGETIVSAGDLVVGDRDGAVVIPRAHTDRVVREAREREASEVEIARHVAAVPLHNLLGLDLS